MAKNQLTTNYRLLITKIKTWIMSNKLEFAVLVLILFVGAFLRLYKIDQYMTFLGDEGRDVIIVRRLLVDFDPILVGPGTSIGNMYLGPIYYYMMAPFLLLFNYSPVGPAVMVALLGVATIFFVWYVAREWFPAIVKGGTLQGVYSLNVGALAASLLYATAPIVIIYSRSSWNPNIMPFFALLTIYSIWQFWENKKNNWLIVSGISMAFALQSHYLGLLLVPVIGFFWLLTLLKQKKDTRYKRQRIRKFLSYTLYAVMFFLVLMSPLVIFDARHGWRNFEAMKTFFTARQTTVSARPWTAIPKLPEVSTEVATRLIAGTDQNSGKLTTIAFALVSLYLVVTMIYIIVTRKGGFKKTHRAFFLILVWLGVSLIGLGIYKQEIYDHYYGFFLAAPFLLIGGLGQSLVNKHKTIGGLIVLLFTCYLSLVNLRNNPLNYPPNRQLQRSQKVSEKIMREAGGEKFNIAVIAERNYEGAYQYFLEKEGSSVVVIDPQRLDMTLTGQLFVVCELPRETCDPVNNPKAEIANFGWSRVDNKWEVAGVLLYKLGHTQ